MRYHPDRNSSPKAAEGFILVNEAYEFLKDPKRRTNSAAKPKTAREKDEEKRRSRHPDWEGMEREAARRRAARHAEQSFSEFEKSSIYKAAKVVDRVYNYVFLAVGLVILFGPFVGLFTMDENERKDYNYYSLILPLLLGVGFLYGIWYFVFNLEKDTSEGLS